MADSLPSFVIPSTPWVKPSDKGHKGLMLLVTHVRAPNYLLDISLSTDAEDKKC